MLIPFIGTHPDSHDRWVNPDHIVWVENEIDMVEDDGHGRERWTVNVVVVADFFVRKDNHDPGRVMSQMVSVHFRKEIDAIEFRNFLIELCNEDRSKGCDQLIADILRNLVAILKAPKPGCKVSVIRKASRKSLPPTIVKPAPKHPRKKKSKKASPGPGWHRKYKKKEVSGDK